MIDGAGSLGAQPKVREKRTPGFFATTVYWHPAAPEFAIFTLSGRDPLPDAKAAYLAAKAIDDAQSDGLEDIWLNGEIREVGLKDVERILFDMLGASLDGPVPVDLDVVNTPFPVMNFPITGTSLASLFATTGSGAAFQALFPHPIGGQIATYFLVVGGTKIVFVAADGVGYALKHGLSYLLLKWMDAPAEFVEAEKRKAQTALSKRRASKPKAYENWEAGV